MPTFYGEDIDVDVDEFLSACNSREISELVDALVNDGHISRSQTEKKEKMCAAEEIFEECLNSLHGNWTRLTKEEEEIIMVIAKRFK